MGYSYFIIAIFILVPALVSFPCAIRDSRQVHTWIVPGRPHSVLAWHERTHYRAQNVARDDATCASRSASTVEYVLLWPKSRTSKDLEESQEELLKIK